MVPGLALWVSEVKICSVKKMVMDSRAEFGNKVQLQFQIYYRSATPGSLESGYLFACL